MEIRVALNRIWEYIISQDIAMVVLSIEADYFIASCNKFMEDGHMVLVAYCTLGLKLC